MPAKKPGKPVKPTGPGKFTIYRDTAEKEGHGWSFRASDRCAGMVKHNLYTADYSVAGLYEADFLAIERKGSVAEWASCLTSPEKWEDFQAELVRLDSFAHPYIVLEFTPKQLEAFPSGTALPASLKRSIKVRGPYLLRRTVEIEFAFRSRIVWAGPHGQPYALSIMKRAWEAYAARPPGD